MHVEVEHLELYALGELSGDLSRIVESHLKTCVACSIQFEESRAIIGQWASPEGPHKHRGERRIGPRTATDDPAMLTILKPERSGRIATTIVNASKEGLRLLVPEALLNGTIVQVHVRDLFILAEVRYCHKAGTQFHAGVHIQDVFPACG